MYPIAFIIFIISTAVLMACDNVALVVSVNPNVRPRGGPQPSSLSPPFINNHNVINNNTSSRETNGGKDAGSEESRLNGDNRIRLVGATDRKSTSTENGSLISAKNKSPQSGSCNSVKTSPHHKIMAKWMYIVIVSFNVPTIFPCSSIYISMDKQTCIELIVEISNSCYVKQFFSS